MPARRAFHARDDVRLFRDSAGRRAAVTSGTRDTAVCEGPDPSVGVLATLKLGLNAVQKIAYEW